MKVIFLDVDGVLNSETYFLTHAEESIDCFIDPVCVQRLKNITDMTGADIVLSSSWRAGWSRHPEEMEISGRMLAESLAACQLEIYDKTPCLQNGDRGKEIKLWLKHSVEKVKRFVILDDYDYNWKKHRLSRRWIRTDFSSGGLQDHDVEKAIKILTSFWAL